MRKKQGDCVIWQNSSLCIRPSDHKAVLSVVAPLFQCTALARLFLIPSIQSMLQKKNKQTTKHINKNSPQRKYVSKNCKRKNDSKEEKTHKKMHQPKSLPQDKERRSLRKGMRNRCSQSGPGRLIRHGGKHTGEGQTDTCERPGFQNKSGSHDTISRN